MRSRRPIADASAASSPVCAQVGALWVVRHAQAEACFITHRDAERFVQALEATPMPSPQGPQSLPRMSFPVRAQTGSRHVWRSPR